MKNLIALLFLFMATNIFAARTYVDLFQIGKEPAVNATTLMLGNTGNSASILRHPGPDGSLYFTQSGNGAIVHNTTGTGTTYFDDNSGTVMYYNSRGSLYIYSSDDGVEGGQINLVGAGGNSSTSIDNYSGYLRFLSSVVSFNGSRLISVGTPAAPTDAANRAYVDGLAPDHTLASGGTISGKTISSLSNNITNINTGDFQAGVIDTDLNSTSGSHNTIPSALATRNYIITNPLEAFTRCITRTVSGSTLTSQRADCLAGEFLTGGGCRGSSSDRKNAEPLLGNGQFSDGAGYFCGHSSVQNITARAICCSD